MHISIATKKITIFNHKKLAHVTLYEKMDGIFFFLISVVKGLQFKFVEITLVQ